MRYEQKMPRAKRAYLQTKSNVIGILAKAKLILKAGPKAYLAKKLDNRTDFPHQLAIAAIFKNETPYLKEWIEFHRLVGVTKFYLFDNESTDNPNTILAPYVEAGIVDLHRIKGKGRQLDAYYQAIDLAKDETKWLAVIDLDEFLLPIEKGKTVLDILEEQRRSALLVAWMVYGSDGHKTKPTGLVTENYRHHATDDFIADYKTIVNPRKVIQVKNPHYIRVIGKMTNERGKQLFQYPYSYWPEAVAAPKQRIRINHYYSKSWEEFRQKSLRGYADSSGKAEREARSLANFKDHDQNQVLDHYIDPYVAALKKKLE